MTGGSADDAQRIGRKLAEIFRCRVFRGSVLYRGGDDFELRPVETLPAVAET